jgi:hypothetical protein
MGKQQQRGKNANKAKIRNSKSKTTKRKSSGILRDSAGRFTSKKSKAKRVLREVPSAPRKRSIKKKTTVRVAADTSTWSHRRTRLKRGEKTLAAASYSRKSLSTGRSSLFFPKIGTEFKTKKKMKQLEAKSYEDKTSYKTIRDDAQKYLKLKSEKSKKFKKASKAVYIKIAYQDKNGHFAFVSAPRQIMDSKEDLNAAIRGLKLKLSGKKYESPNIVGYEVEEII